MEIFFPFYFLFCFWLYIANMYASIERLFWRVFFHRGYSRLSISGMEASCAANFWFRLIWIRLIQEPLECRNESKNLVLHLAVNLCFPVFPDVADELDLSPGWMTQTFKHTKIWLFDYSWKEYGWSNFCWAYLHSKCRHLNFMAQTHLWDWKYCQRVVKILSALQYDSLLPYSLEIDHVVYDLITKHQFPAGKQISRKHISFSHCKYTRW